MKHIATGLVACVCAAGLSGCDSRTGRPMQTKAEATVQTAVAGSRSQHQSFLGQSRDVLFGAMGTPQLWADDAEFSGRRCYLRTLRLQEPSANSERKARVVVYCNRRLLIVLAFVSRMAATIPPDPVGQHTPLTPAGENVVLYGLDADDRVVWEGRLGPDAFIAGTLSAADAETIPIEEWVEDIWRQQHGRDQP